MIWLFFLAAGLLLLFALVLLFGAPYLPTLKPQLTTALELLNLKSGQTLLELGCGDGRVLRLAAQKGLRGVGYEINPVLVLVAKVVTWRYRRLVSVKWGNYWRADWPQAEGIFVFLLDRYMEKLDKKITQQYKGKNVKLVSFAFKIPGKKAAQTKNGLYLYRY